MARELPKKLGPSSNLTAFKQPFTLNYILKKMYPKTIHPYRTGAKEKTYFFLFRDFQKIFGKND